MALTSKVEAFKKHFDIESETEDVEFCLDNGNLVAKFQGSEYILNNQTKKNKDQFLSYATLRYTKKYGDEFLRAIQLEGTQFEEIYTDKQLLISHYEHIYNIRPEWDIESYCYVNEERELILNEECCKDLQIPQKFKPFMLFSLDDETNQIRYYRFQFGPKLLEFLGVNTQPGCESVQKAYKQDLKHRRKKLTDLSMEI